MQLSYNIIKKSQVSTNTIYAIKTPVRHINSETSLSDAQKRSEHKIISAEEILGNAVKERDRILDESRMEADRIKKDAYEKAFKQGFNEGLIKGNEEGLKSTEDLRKDSECVLMEAHRVSREYIDNSRSEIISLSLGIAEKIIGHQADSNDSVIVKIAKAAIDSAVLKEQVTIKINPMDYAIIDVRRDEIIKAAGDSIIINIVKDNVIKRGGCILDSGVSTVDATIDTQLEKIKVALLGF